MYVVGHCVVTDRSGVCPTAEVYGEGILGLMFPDYVRCHDWGYGCCFEPWWTESSVADRMIQAHLLGDYFVHFGPGTRERRREGWAYRNMGIYARRYDEFFSRAAAAGIREAGPPPDSIRGFSHTMVEYTIDTYLARLGAFDTVFAEVHATLGRLASPATDSVARAWIDDTIIRHKIPVEQNLLEEDLESFGARIRISHTPEEFALNAGVKKFQLTPCAESRALLREFLTQGVAEIGAPAIETFLGECARYLAECMSRRPAMASVN